MYETGKVTSTETSRSKYSKAYIGTATSVAVLSCLTVKAFSKYPLSFSWRALREYTLRLRTLAAEFPKISSGGTLREYPLLGWIIFHHTSRKFTGEHHTAIPRPLRALLPSSSMSSATHYRIYSNYATSP